VVTYSNAAADKSRVLTENKKKSGVYIWINLLNGKVYTGSALNISKRFYQYSNLNYLKRTTSMPICRALLKHGHENFSFSRFGVLPHFQMDRNTRKYSSGTNPIIPIVSYTDVLEQKKQTMQDNKGKSGVYR
jgi:group I intron endonuclease